ncbi:hypothetical protein OCT63_19780 [Vibrio sp. RW]|uniref:hypothetical protein n=1 Tax=Vibrio sp. RW TaxID=2998833 RepID=UPI0022CD58CF|nr:hypothetical protein [Vibrio sp. RW]MDA0146470.1 hypothetical protein [Vibrio sp. RW]
MKDSLKQLIFTFTLNGRQTMKHVKVFCPETSKNIDAAYCEELQAVMFFQDELYTNSFMAEFVKGYTIANSQFMPVYPIDHDEKGNVIRVRLGIADRPSCVVLEEDKAYPNSLYYHHYAIYNDENNIIHKVVETLQECDEFITEQYRMLKRDNLQFKDIRYWSDNGNHKERLTGALVF